MHQAPPLQTLLVTVPFGSLQASFPGVQVKKCFIVQSQWLARVHRLAVAGGGEQW